MSNVFGQISLSCLKTSLADVAEDNSGNKKPSDLQFWFMEFPGNLSNALHLQQQALRGGKWRSLPWPVKNGDSGRAGNLGVSLKYLYPPQFNDKFCSSALQDWLWALPSSGCGERGLALAAHSAAFPPSQHNTWDRRKCKTAFPH